MNPRIKACRRAKLSTYICRGLQRSISFRGSTEKILEWQLLTRGRILQHFLQLRKLSRSAGRMLCRPALITSSFEVIRIKQIVVGLNGVDFIAAFLSRQSRRWRNDSDKQTGFVREACWHNQNGRVQTGSFCWKHAFEVWPDMFG